MQKQLSIVIGIILAILGIWGFFANGDVLGFAANTLLNVVYLVGGLWLMFAAFGGKAQMMALAAQVTGVVYGIIGLLGLIGLTFITSWFGVNVPGEILMFIAGLILLYFGFVMKGRRA